MHRYPAYTQYRAQPLLETHRRSHLRPRKHDGRETKSSRASQIVGVVLLCLLILVIMKQNWTRGKKEVPPQSQEDVAETRRLLDEHPSSHACQQAREPRICAHGGDVLAAPPNTKRAFEAALAGGADCVEVDVSMTRDGHLIVLHNRELQQLLGSSSSMRNGKKITIPDITWQHIQHLDWNGKVHNSESGDKVELFIDIITLAMEHAAHITIDVKLNENTDDIQDAEAMAQAVLDALKEAGCNHRCLIWAKSDAFITKVLELQPEGPIKTGYVVFNESEEARALGMHQPWRLPAANVMAVHWALVTPALIKKAADEGKEVHVWTANTPLMMRAALDSGPHAVVTSFPSELRQSLEKRKAACFRNKV